MVLEEQIQKNSPAYQRRRMLWKAVNRARAKFIKPVTALWAKYLRELIDGSDDAVSTALRETYKMVGTPFAVREVNKLERLKQDTPSLTNTLGRQMELYVTDQLGAVGESIRNTTLNAASVILTNPDISQAEKLALIDELILRRSQIIAQNEVIQASNAGQQMGFDYYTSENPTIAVFRTWLATIDSRVRPDHENADGQTVRGNDPFTVGGELLQHPGDPAGSPDNTLWCRCAVDYFKQELRN